MCGIAGLISDRKQGLKEEIKKMTDIIAHRGPDGEGHYIHNNVALGHRRLAIVDLTDNGAQPMEYLNYMIVYNGEIYNYIELREYLRAKGYNFKSECDTEVIGAAYAHWGKECLEHFNGMWSFAILDKTKGEVFCARDRFGVKPFYYMPLKGKFAFASEIKQFSVLPEWKAIANIQRVYDFLQYGIFDHTRETLFEGVFQLRGGEALTFFLCDKKFNVWKWYELEKNIDKSYGEFSTEKNKFLEYFTNAVELRLRADVKGGSCLSGGVDSSSITCVANQLLKKKGKEQFQETVSSCFHIEKYDEQKYIDIVTNETGTINHKVFPKYEDLFKELDEITWHQDEPFTSTSIFCQWNVFKEARHQKIKVMLDGQGADEQLAGYGGFFMANFESLRRKHKYISLIKEIKAYNELFGNRRKNKAASILYAIVQGMLPLNMKNFLRGKKKNADLKWLRKDEDTTVNKNRFENSTMDIQTHSLNQLKFTSLPALLHYEDRNSMAHSIESRVPFLDYRIVEKVLSLPDNYKIDHAQSKFVLRRAMDGILPKAIQNRHDKLGFVSPEEVWIRSNSETFRREIIEACERLKEIVDKEAVLTWYDEKLASKEAFGYTFWKIISLGRWMKVFDVQLKYAQ